MHKTHNYIYIYLYKYTCLYTSLLFMYCVYVCACSYYCGNQRAACRNWFSLSTMQVYLNYWQVDIRNAIWLGKRGIWKREEYKSMFIALLGSFFFYLKLFILKTIHSKYFWTVFLTTHIWIILGGAIMPANILPQLNSFSVCPSCLSGCVPWLTWFRHQVRKLSIFPSPAGGKTSNREKILHHKAPLRRRLTALIPVTRFFSLCFIS